jgi:hypothetical protein
MFKEKGDKMTPKDMKSLDRGDLVRSKWEGRTYVVSANYGDRVTAVDTIDITNPSEWQLIRKANYEKAEEEIKPKKKTIVLHMIDKAGDVKECAVEIPEGHHICDGTRGTPDLRDTDPRWPKYNEEGK